MLVIKSFVFNFFTENTFIVWDEESKEGAVIDPGCSQKSEEEKLEKYISENNINIKYLLNTHCHVDHIWGCKFIKDKYNPVYYAPELDMSLLENVNVQASAFGLEIEKPPKPDKYIKEDEQLTIGNSTIEFLFTPGHTAGEFCFYFRKEAFCFTGDVIFNNNIGRTDLWGGDYSTLLKSIKTKLFTLPDNVVIYPGHGGFSKVGVEKRNNPFLYELSSSTL